MFSLLYTVLKRFHFFFLYSFTMSLMYESSSYSKKIALFWKNAFNKVSSGNIHDKGFKLPFARIKRLMKVEEDVKMVAAEVPVLFSLVTEIFIQELTMRAWMSTEDGRRKILQLNDINFAVKTSSMYDFLTYIVSYQNYENKDYFLSDQKWLTGRI